MILKNGQSTLDARLDRCRHVDLRSLQFPVSELLTVEQYKTPRSYTWGLTERLDQGTEGACVGYAWSHELAAKPGVVSGITNTFARDYYWDAQRGDPWAGGSYPGAKPIYEGTSTGAGAKIALQRGLIREYRWAFDLMDLVTAVGYIGPAVIGIDWYEDMLDPDSSGFIRPTGEIVGGHCICAIGIKAVKASNGTLDLLQSSLTLHNSWGPSWGRDGRCYLSLVDVMALWSAGDFCIPLGRVSAQV